MVVDRNNRVGVHGTLACHLTFWACLNDSACTLVDSYFFFNKWWQLINDPSIIFWSNEWFYAYKRTLNHPTLYFRCIGLLIYFQCIVFVCIWFTLIQYLQPFKWYIDVHVRQAYFFMYWEFLWLGRYIIEMAACKVAVLLREQSCCFDCW